MIGIFTALSQSNISVHSVDGLIQKTQVFGQAGFQSGSFPFSTRLRRLYSLSTVKTLRRTRTIPPAMQATENSQESKGSVSQLMDDLDLINSVEKVEAMVNSLQKGVENVLRN